MCIKLRIQFSQALSVYTCKNMRIAYLITYHLHSWSVVVIWVCVLFQCVFWRHITSIWIYQLLTLPIAYRICSKQYITPSPSFAVETPSRYPPSMAMEFDEIEWGGWPKAGIKSKVKRQIRWLRSAGSLDVFSVIQPPTIFHGWGLV